MRRLLSIFLSVAIWGITSGSVGLFHHHLNERHDANTPAHDESHCQLCVALHAPLLTAQSPRPVFASEITGFSLVPFLTSIPHQASPGCVTCRGPPIC